VAVRDDFKNFFNFKMTAYDENNFKLTRDRSAACGKYEFQFYENSGRAVVPILQRYRSGEFRIIGTGSYFIKPSLFITAAHIFEGDDINPDDSFSIIIDGSVEPIPIVEKHVHEYLDLAIVLIDESCTKHLENINPLAVMDLPPEKSEIVAVFGYSHSIVDPMNSFTDDSGNVLQYLRLRSKWEVGGVLKIHNSGARLLKGQCFETSVLAEGRDSGAPMFNSNGFLIGLLSTSWEFDSGLPNSLCVSILELADIPINGTLIKELWLKEPRAAFCKIIKS